MLFAAAAAAAVESAVTAVAVAFAAPLFGEGMLLPFIVLERFGVEADAMGRGDGIGAGSLPPAPSLAAPPPPPFAAEVPPAPLP